MLELVDNCSSFKFQMAKTTGTQLHLLSANHSTGQYA